MAADRGCNVLTIVPAVAPRRPRVPELTVTNLWVVPTSCGADDGDVVTARATLIRFCPPVADDVATM